MELLTDKKTTLREIGDTVALIKGNLEYRTPEGEVKRATRYICKYTDSILYVYPIDFASNQQSYNYVRDVKGQHILEFAITDTLLDDNLASLVKGIYTFKRKNALVISTYWQGIRRQAVENYKTNGPFDNILFTLTFSKMCRGLNHLSLENMVDKEHELESLTDSEVLFHLLNRDTKTKVKDLLPEVIVVTDEEEYKGVPEDKKDQPLKPYNKGATYKDIIADMEGSINPYYFARGCEVDSTLADIELLRISGVSKDYIYYYTFDSEAMEFKNGSTMPITRCLYAQAVEIPSVLTSTTLKLSNMIRPRATYLDFVEETKKVIIVAQKEATLDETIKHIENYLSYIDNLATVVGDSDYLTIFFCKVVQLVEVLRRLKGCSEELYKLDFLPYYKAKAGVPSEVVKNIRKGNKKMPQSLLKTFRGKDIDFLDTFTDEVALATFLIWLAPEEFKLVYAEESLVDFKESVYNTLNETYMKDIFISSIASYTIGGAGIKDIMSPLSHSNS